MFDKLMHSYNFFFFINTYHITHLHVCVVACEVLPSCHGDVATGLVRLIRVIRQCVHAIVHRSSVDYGYGMNIDLSQFGNL